MKPPKIYKKVFKDSIEIPLEKGQSFRYGKFKNKTAIYSSHYTNDKGDLIIITDTGKEIPAMKVRLISEAKQVGNIYHLTELQGMLKIIDDNILKSNYYTYISTTRNKNFNYYLGMRPSTYFKLELDGNKISNKYKVYPYSFSNSKGEHLDEFEEIIEASEIKHIDSYVLKYIFLIDNFEEGGYSQKDVLLGKGSNMGYGKRFKLVDLKKLIQKIPKNKLYLQKGSRIYQDNTYFNNLFDNPTLKENSITKFTILDEALSAVNPMSSSFNHLNYQNKQNVFKVLKKQGDLAKRDYEWILRLHNQGKSNEDIAKVTGYGIFVIALVIGIEKDSLKEDLKLADFKKHMGTSDFTKDWVEVRRKIVGAGNKSSKLKSLKVNRKSDYITFTFTSVPTYDSKVSTVNPDTLQMGTGKSRKYTQEIRILDFFKLASTKPGYIEKEMSVAEIKEILKVASIQVWCNDPSFNFQGMAWTVTQMDAAIYPQNIAPKHWDSLHNGDNYLCKHLSSIFNSIDFYIPIMAGMINKVIKK